LVAQPDAKHTRQSTAKTEQVFMFDLQGISEITAH